MVRFSVLSCLEGLDVLRKALLTFVVIYSRGLGSLHRSGLIAPYFRFLCIFTIVVMRRNMHRFQLGYLPFYVTLNVL